jgi:hypothetical protein
VSNADPAPEHREVWLAVPGPTPGTAWVDASGRLPYVAFDIEAASTTVSALQRSVLPGLGVGGPILGCLLRYDEPWTPATTVSALVEVEPQPAGWVAPDGWRVVDVDVDVEGELAGELAGTVHGLLRPRLADWLAEQRGAAPDPLAPPWSRPGWHARAAGWIAGQLAGRGPIEVEQMRAWGISTVLRATDPTGTRYWFKGICEHFRREVGVTAALDAVAPGYVAPVLAADLAAGWLLLGDLTDVAPAGEPASHRTAYPLLRALQRAVAGERDRLIAAGAAVRPLADIPAAFAEVISDPTLAEWHGASPERAEQLVAWVTEAVAEVAALGLPEVLVHGDFHPGNVATLADGTRVIFDWSDAAFAAPFVDVPTWLTWIDDDAAERERTWQSFAAEWVDVLPADEWLARRTLLEGVAGAYHVVSYAGIVRSMDRHHVAEHARGIAEFVAFVDVAASARQVVSPSSPTTA